MSAEFLAGIAGILLSLVFSYVPGLNEKYAAFAKETKQLIMAGLLALIALVIFGLSCTTWAAAWGINVTCNQAGAQELVTVFVAALVANQGLYMISPAVKRVRAAKVPRE